MYMGVLGPVYWIPIILLMFRCCLVHVVYTVQNVEMISAQALIRVRGGCWAGFDMLKKNLAQSFDGCAWESWAQFKVSLSQLFGDLSHNPCVSVLPVFTPNFPSY